MHWALDGRVTNYTAQTKCCGTSHVNVSDHRKVLLQFLGYLEKKKTCLVLYFFCAYKGSTAVAQWLRCCATNRKVAGSIPAVIH